MRVVIVSGLLCLLAGCTDLGDYVTPGLAYCDGEDVDIRSNPLACGACPGKGAVCAEGVACVEYFCDYTSVMHCGAAYRACVGPGAVACVKVDEGAALAGDEAIVNGYACVRVDAGDDRADGDGGVGADAWVPGEVPGEVPEVRPGAAYGRPSWLFVPSASDHCDGGDPRRCHHAWIDFTDVCGETCRLPFTHNFQMMTTELSRAHFREALCDCDRVRSEECADVCTHRGPEVDALPMTGLNWCMAQLACEAVGGRLPTAAEQARFEQFIGERHAAPDLFHGGSCEAWRAATGSAPRVAECLDSGAAAEMARVDDERGSVVVETLFGPVRVHHSLGNAGEWKLDAPAAARCETLVSEFPLRAPPEWVGLRTMQGRSMASPMGEVGNALAVLAPGTRGADLGVRCARSTVAPAGLEGALVARREDCASDTPIGQAAVRGAGGERVYRAVEAHVVSRRPGTGRLQLRELEAAAREEAMPLVWRDVHDPQIGQAWLSPDAQWWIGEPARLGEVMSFETVRRQPFMMTWAEARVDAMGEAGRAMEFAYADDDGFMARRLEFVIERDQLDIHVFGASALDPTAVACEHFECVETVDPGACPTRCPAWRLPIVVGFQQLVATAGDPAVCR